VSEGAAPAADPRASARRDRIAVVLLVAAALAIRLAAVSRKVLWFDEFLTAAFARRSWAGLVRAIRHEAHPPLYFLSMKAWTDVFGDGAFALKAFSVIAGTAALVVLHRAARTAFGSRGAIAAGVLFAFSTVQIDQSTDAKPYALLVMMAALLLAALAAAAVRPESGARSAAAVLLAGLTAATHFYGCAAAIVIAACAAIAFRYRARRTAAAALAAAAAASALWLPGALRLPSGASDYIRDIWRSLPVWAPIPVSLRFSLPGFRKTISAVPGAVLPYFSLREGIGAAVIAAIFLAALGDRRRRAEVPDQGEPRRFLILAGWALLCGLLLLETVSGALGRPIGLPGRFEVLPEMGLALLVGAAVSRLSAGSARTAIAAVLAVSIWTAVPEWRPRFSALPIRREEFIVRSLARRLGPNGRAAIVTLGLARPPFDYYLRGDRRIRLISFPREQQSHIGWHAETVSPGERAGLSREAAGLCAEMEANLEEGVPVFLAARPDPRNTILLDRLAAARLSLRPTPLAAWFFAVDRSARPLLKPGTEESK